MAHEEIFLNMLHQGIIDLSADGTFYRHFVIRRPGGSPPRFIPVVPRPFGWISHNTGYIKLSLHRIRNGVSHTFDTLAHRVVWMFFYGSIPEKMEINHIDGIKQHNSIGNLELVTRKENVYHAMYVTGAFNPRGEHNPNAKLKSHEVKRIRELYRNGVKIHEIAKKFTIVTATQIWRIVHGLSRKEQ